MKEKRKNKQIKKKLINKTRRWNKERKKSNKKRRKTMRI